MVFTWIKKIFPLPWRHSALVRLPWALIFILLDQLSKVYALQNLILNKEWAIFPGFNLTLVYNYGAAFGFLNQGLGWQHWFFSSLALIATVGFIVWLARTPKKPHAPGIAIILLLSGAVGNLCDRWQYGYVIDFLDCYIGTYHWPAFNLADSFICLGAIGLISRMLFKPPVKDFFLS